ncbi:hypothetical protein [Bacillus alveayuensis]|jgi:hypothetical protein|uniref:hypothetical protein n=1 Tax=Aeribacillus alveayuensis TaxID=279215 RepID=UPI0005CC9B5A|nr:hypothetical protein [Bacillus alveayuensis]
MNKRMFINIVSIACCVIAYFILFSLFIIRFSFGSYGPIAIWSLFVFPLIGFITSLFGEKGILNKISLLTNLSAIVFCSGWAAIAIFLYLTE